MSVFMKFYDEGGGSLEVGRSFVEDDKILFEIEQDNSGSSILLDFEGIKRLIDFLGLELSKIEGKGD